MKIPLKWCIAILLRLSQTAVTLTTVQLQVVFDAKLTLISRPQTLNPATSLDSELGDFPTIPPVSTSLILAQYNSVIPIMPLHLLGKKSWNVYNKANIEKVRRDEAIAKAEEDAEEQLMQEIDAARRLAILRGEEPPPLPTPESTEKNASVKISRSKAGERRGEKRPRKRYGEDDTDFELRVAREKGKSLSVLREEGGEEDDGVDVSSTRKLVLTKETTRNEPVIDARGHINLFPQDAIPISHSKPQSLSKAEEREARANKIQARKEKQVEDQIALRFDNAGGYGKGLMEKAWYEKSGRNGLGGSCGGEEEEVDMIVVEKDVWGNSDPRRKERDISRMANNDPLALMKAGSRKLKEVESSRGRAREEREKEMEELRDRELEEEERMVRRKRKYGDERGGSLEGLLRDEDGEGREKRRRRDDERRREVRDLEGYRSKIDRGDHRRKRSDEGDHGERDRRRERQRDDDYDRRGHRERRYRSHHQD